MRYVIAGAGPAGVNAAETLRQLDPQAEITLFGGEAEPAYSRMAIPYLLAGDIAEQGTWLRQHPDHWARLHIDLRRDRVTGLDTAGCRVQLASGAVQPYDRLLLATGSSPLRPPVPGLDGPGVHHCWTLEDARAIERLARPGARVVLLGAGFIGCIILESLVRRGVQLTVLEMGDRMVPRMLDQTAGGLVKDWCVAKGVDVRTSVRVTAVRPGAEPQTLEVQIDPGQPLAADLVVVAAGVRPNVGFLKGSGVALEDGVLVDEHLCSNVPGVYAAGDCCQGLDWSSGGRAVHAIQPTATEHGRVAALNMAGRPTRYAGSLNMNVLDTLGLISTSYGLWMGVPDGHTASRLETSAWRYVKLQFRDDRLVGAVTLGHTDGVGVLRGLIQTGLPLGGWKDVLMEDPSRFVEAYLARTQSAGFGTA